MAMSINPPLSAPDQDAGPASIQGSGDAPDDLPTPPFLTSSPKTALVPLVFASPHSGRVYPASFQAASRLDPVRLRCSEDAFMDEIFSNAPDFGAPLLSATFPRAYVDPNREAFELDPAMFEDPLPDYVTTDSPRIRAGLGTIARVVTNGEEIYNRPLRFSEAKARIESLHIPYHNALEALLTLAHEQFGACLLVDCHSMPSIGGPMDRDPGLGRVDMVLGDCHGTSCAPAITRLVETTLKDMGYVVTRNAPYAGGYTTRHYGQPNEGIHAIQIEINRRLYMDETALERIGGIAQLTDNVSALIGILSKAVPDLLAGPK